jgi:SAM-dependent methyltransferase
MLQSTVVLCPVCGHCGELGNGPAGRPRASCRTCGSLERHRALVGILPGLRDVASCGALVDVAPSPLTSDRLKALAADAGVPYVGLDFDPGADKRVVTVQASLTELPLADAAAGIMVCFHVLEHIPDDAAAMREIRRTLAPGGVAIIQVPYRADRLTDEDPSAPVEERLRRFGQADHVRYYGTDFEDRLAAAGLAARRIRMRDLYRPLEMDLLGILPDEPLWLCAVGAEVEVPELAARCTEVVRESAMASIEQLVDERDQLRQALQDLRKDASHVRAELKRTKRERDRVVVRERALRTRPDVRVVSAIARRVRRVRTRS